MVYVGIDVAKDFHECAILSQDKEVLLAPFSFSNTKEGFVYLKEMINLAGNADPLNVKIGLEATGHYSVALLSFLEHNGWRIIYLNPLSVAKAKKARSLRRTKTDKSDALYIAELIIDERLRAYTASSPDILALKSLTRARYRLSKELQIIKGRIKRSIHLLFPELPDLFVNLYRKAVLNVLKKYPSAEDVSKANLTVLTNLLKSNSHGVFGKTKAKQLKERAKNSIATYSPGDALELKLLAERILFMHEQRATIDEEVERIMREINSPITTIPGIGNITGAAILSEIGDISRFDTSSKLQAFTGTDPCVYQSGKFNANNTPMVKRGSSYLRHSLYLATCMASMTSPTFSSYVAKKKEQGKHYYVAIGHAMKKMIRIIFHVLKTGKSFVELSA